MPLTVITKDKNCIKHWRRKLLEVRGPTQLKSSDFLLQNLNSYGEL